MVHAMICAVQCCTLICAMVYEHSILNLSLLPVDGRIFGGEDTEIIL